jgi:hypothetical protein
MLPVRIISYVERAQPVPTGVAPVQRRPDATTSTPLPTAELAPRPPYERRRQGNRRVMERREDGQAAFLDTRTPQGRRRSGGRRASDEPATRIAISVIA